MSDGKKPREFWIDNREEYNKGSDFFLHNVMRGVMNYSFDGSIHVIEMSAYLSLLNEVNKLKSDCLNNISERNQIISDFEVIMAENRSLRTIIDSFRYLGTDECPHCERQPPGADYNRITIFYQPSEHELHKDKNKPGGAYE